MQKLKKKDWAKILYSLYGEVYNHYVFVRFPLEVEEERKKKFLNLGLLEEEIWAYENKLVFLPDGLYLARIGTIREEYVGKRMFLLSVVEPAYRICVNPDVTIYNLVLDKFAVENHFFKEIFSDEKEQKEWFSYYKAESISVKDAEKIAQNIKNFFASRNC